MTMAAKDPRIDAYIARSPDFAKPILKHLRKLVHSGCPKVEETMKWSSPYFMHKGMLCNMASFKHHCVFGFWKGKLIFKKDAEGVKREAMGHFGRITSLADLPSDRVLLGYIREAAKVNEQGVKLPSKPKPKPKKELIVPDDLQAALGRNKKASTTFDGFSYSHKKEYVEWITEAKRDETRAQRLETAVCWMAEGKPRHWKYVNC
jgi:uncharacterized protein YdeI (YjbR/CyaY-like superfamily)